LNGAALARLAVLEAEHAVRRTLSRYMALCDVPARTLPGETLAALFFEDAVWEGVGAHYASKFGKLTGHDEILAMLTRYLPPTPHFTSNTHFLTSEMIEVTPDASRATGRWIMLQASGYVAGHAELITARLEVDFEPAHGTADPTAPPGDWLIRHFRTERLFDAPWQLNPRARSEPGPGSR
jgi:SnoaL-like domain